MLGIPYVWAGVTQAGMDCSAWLSSVWGVSRQTTDTLSSVADPITRADLMPGDALNLPTWKDPSGAGHVRLFAGWANADQTLMTVFEETSLFGKSVRRVIPYDPKYQPMRLRGVDAGASPAAPTQPANAQPPQPGIQTPGMPEPGAPSGPAPVAGPTDPSSLPVQAPGVLGGFADSFGGIAAAIGALPSAISQPFVQAYGQLAGLMAWLGQVNIYQRLGLVVLGAFLVLVGVILFALSFVDARTARSVVPV